MAQINVRFIHNFIMQVVQTTEQDGKLVVTEKSVHIHMGDIYILSQYQRAPDGRLTLHFADSSPVVGVAHNIESDYCELNEPNTAKKTTSGCGGCGNKGK